MIIPVRDYRIYIYMFVSTFWLDSELGVEIRKGCKTNSCSCFNESPEISFGYLQCSKALKSINIP